MCICVISASVAQAYTACSIGREVFMRASPLFRAKLALRCLLSWRRAARHAASGACAPLIAAHDVCYCFFF